MRKRRAPHARMLDKVQYRRATGCWIFTGCINPQNGYGYIGVGVGGSKRLETCHRVAYRAWIGQIPTGADLHHTCETRSCCNPHHLRIVTRGENAGLGKAAKLTPEIVRYIRETKIKGCVLAQRYGVSENTISHVRTRKTWTWLA